MDVNPIGRNAGREGETPGWEYLNAVKIGIIQFLRSLLMKERALLSS